MSQPIQLIINEVLLPTTTHDRYQCFPEELREQIQMISGRIVEEVRGKVWRVEYTSGRMSDALTRQLLTALRAKGSKPVTFLPDDSDDMKASTFLVESLTPPTLSFFDGSEPVWTGLSFTLREVKPHA